MKIVLFFRGPWTPYKTVYIFAAQLNSWISSMC